MWINVDGVHDVKLIEKIGKRFGLHDLVLKDVVNTEQRPKMENFDDHLFVVLKMLSKKDDKSNRIEIEQVSFVLGEKFVISFQEKEGDVFDPVRERIRNEKSPIRKMGADYLLYSLIDEVVGNYFVILEKLGEEMELLEEALISRRSKNAMNRIHRLKVELIHLRKSVWPLREVFSAFTEINALTEVPLVKKATKIYFRDVYGNVIQAIDAIETYREMLSGMLDIHLSSVGNRLNGIMKP